ncbi:mitochondrial import inner membrane translocase subunit Tim10 [Colletes gigas]|uniref:mitochondrial import inner membrane translocase subunit Tim10 n=1 Tax=Colletes gigas TaxID=935657 RepID=UPI001C9A3AEF|nr:mitochondrial import inner membrane translocase subunit Tim10 [Colletes gigas]XP_043256610.1 mitochondrial import inner membrane translocase subunit Tim10 [Colletes gigas]
MAAFIQLNENQLKMVQELEMEMMSDMYTRMTSACHRKCIPPKYLESELTKGESICLDRCVSKYLDVHERIGMKFTQISMQADNFMKDKDAEQK